MIQEMIEKIYIRPVKQRYYIHDLGPKCYSFEPENYLKKRKNYRNLSGKGINKSSTNSPQSSKEGSISIKKNVKREDHTISSQNSEKLQVSFYKLEEPNNHELTTNKEHKLSSSYFHENNAREWFNNTCKNYGKEITLVYLHTHNGSRLEGLSLIEPILSLGVNFCTLDFSGYGNSSGNDVSLGVKEIYDLQKVLLFLEENYEQVGFILWGRSMGAVTALRYLGSGLHEEDNFNILGAIYDSPFSSLEKLTYEMASKALNIPESLLTPLVMIIKASLSEKLPFEKLELEPLMKNIDLPGMFISSKNDTFISHEHTDTLYKSYKCRDKQILFVEKNHNEGRSFGDLIRVYEFIEGILKKFPNKQKIVVENLMKLRHEVSNISTTKFDSNRKYLIDDNYNYGRSVNLRDEFLLTKRKVSISSSSSATNEFFMINT